eukprot:scaffold145398_cov38-Prasinocladus_malaysianus.AAC.2
MDFRVGQQVYYRRKTADGSYQKTLAEVVATDEGITPGSYKIRFQNGSTRETDGMRLSPAYGDENLSPKSAGEAGLTGIFATCIVLGTGLHVTYPTRIASCCTESTKTPLLVSSPSSIQAASPSGYSPRTARPQQPTMRSTVRSRCHASIHTCTDEVFDNIRLGMSQYSNSHGLLASDIQTDENDLYEFVKELYKISPEELEIVEGLREQLNSAEAEQVEMQAELISVRQKAEELAAECEKHRGESTQAQTATKDTKGSQGLAPESQVLVPSSTKEECPDWLSSIANSVLSRWRLWASVCALLLLLLHYIVVASSDLAKYLESNDMSSRDVLEASLSGSANVENLSVVACGVDFLPEPQTNYTTLIGDQQACEDALESDCRLCQNLEVRLILKNLPS